MKDLVTAPCRQAHSVVFRYAIIGISLLVLFLPATIQGQNLKINNIGMAVLGSWGLALT